MSDLGKHFSVHSVDEDTRYDELHDAFVDDVVNKGLPADKALRYHGDGKGAYVYISGRKSPTARILQSLRTRENLTS